MHEWSVMQAVVESILRFAEMEGLKKVTRVEIAINQIAQLELDILREAYSVLTENTIAQGSEIEITVSPAVFKCNNCGHEWTLNDVLDTLEKEVEQFLVIDEEGTADPPLHYMPMLIYSYIKCPKCGSRDFEVKESGSVKIVKIEGEK